MKMQKLWALTVKSMFYVAHCFKGDFNATRAQFF